MTIHDQWLRVLRDYLNSIEKVLKEADCADCEDILQNVSEHLDQKFGELSEQDKTWENFLKIISDMGPAEDYVQLMGSCNSGLKPKKQLEPRWMILAICGVVILIVSMVLLIMENNPSPKVQTGVEFEIVPPAEVKPSAVPNDFVNDPQALGKWVSVDFVRNIEDFKPDEKSWGGNLHLQYIILEPEGIMKVKVKTSSGEYPDRWTKGQWIDPEIPAKYIVKEYDDQKYMFMEWISGDVTIRGMKPSYYVLKPIVFNDFVNDPQVLGKWVSVDFVRNMEDFKPGRKSWRGNLFLQYIILEPEGILKMKSNRSSREFPHKWTKGQLKYSELPGKYDVKEYYDQKYLFMEWISGDVTIRGMRPSYYVLKEE